jgi:RNA polymerase sigma-70 factor (ECF subfamily)
MNPSASVPDEPQLIAALQRGEAAAFETLVRHHGDMLYRLAVRVLGNEADARDAVQDGFISVFKEIKRFEARATLKAWLYRIILNAALMRRRARSRKNEVSIDDLLPQIEEFRHEPEWNFTESAEDIVTREHLQQHIRGQIDRLPEAYRTVLLLRDIEGYDTRETAELLGDSEGSVKVRLHRARAALKTLLEPFYKGEVASS